MKSRSAIISAIAVMVLAGCQIIPFDRPLARETYIESLLQASERNPHGRFWRAKELLERGKGKKAEKYFREAIREQPDRAEFYVGLGVTLEEQGKRRKAQNAYRQALSCNQESVQAMIRLGRLAWKQGSLSEADRWVRQAGQLGDNASLWRLRGEIAYIKGDYAEAQSCWHESIKRDATQGVLLDLVDDLARYNRSADSPPLPTNLE
jgi:tetratricopeptide (TPR) repeat protein